MPITTRVVRLDGSGTFSLFVAPCFYAGNQPVGTTVGDSLAGVLNDKYDSGSLPFIEGKLSVTGAPDTDAIIFLDFDL